MQRRQFESQQAARREEAASAEFLRRQYPNARMCPRCRCGPVINENCFDYPYPLNHGFQGEGVKKVSYNYFGTPYGGKIL